jgi:pimeloyl-ACP methyl ester carboxylesterase
MSTDAIVHFLAYNQRIPIQSHSHSLTLSLSLSLSHSHSHSHSLTPLTSLDAHDDASADASVDASYDADSKATGDAARKNKAHRRTTSFGDQSLNSCVLVIFPGIFDDKANWDPAARYMARKKKITIVIVDMTGHGSSDGERYVVDMDEWQQDVMVSI